MSGMERHYDQHYYFSEKYGPKKYCNPDGTEGSFGYTHGGLWNYQKFLEKLVELLDRPDSVLDIGAGCGGFVATLLSNSIKALGLEFSNYAIKHCQPLAKYFVILWNIENVPWYPLHPPSPTLEPKKYTWVTAIDLFEHLFDDNVGSVIQECKEHAEKYIIAKICTAQLPHEVWTAKRGSRKQVYEQAKKEGYEWLVVSGHVNCQFPDYWRKKFEDDEWQLRDDLSRKLLADLKLPEDWRTTLILERKIQQKNESLPSTFTQEWYDEKYFAEKQGKTYRKKDGSTACWGYRNPEGEYLASAPIVKGWKTVFNPRNMLDVGCGRGTFIAYSRQQDIQAEGFDFSEWAVNHLYPRCKPEWVKLHDATKPWPYKDEQFNLVTVLDLLEHIYEPNLGFILQELRRVTKKFIFLQVAIAGSGGLQGEKPSGYILKQGEPIPVNLEENAVAGHVTVQPEQYWHQKLEHENFMMRRDLVNWFCTIVPKDNIKNWLLNSIIIMEKIKEEEEK